VGRGVNHRAPPFKPGTATPDRALSLRMTKLVYIDDSLPGITRKGAGTGFAYYSPAGDLIRDRAEKTRLNAIALPPAYRDAWFCPAPNGHILATGYDDAGRKQYRYHPDFRMMREGDKFDKCEAFGRLLPLIRARVDEDLSQPQVTQTRAIASVVRLLDLSAVRIGNRYYAQNNDSFGATTLRRDHAELKSGGLELQFTGKGGRRREITLDDPRLSRAIRRMDELPRDRDDADLADRLFRFEDAEGHPQPVTSHDVNSYLRDTMGEDFSAKHFRTWHASVIAFEMLAGASEPITIRAMLEVVSDHLGNTEATARKSYIHPAVIARIEDQEQWRDTLTLPRANTWLTRHERGLLQLLEQSPAAGELLAA